MLTISSSVILWISLLRFCCQALFCALCSLMSVQVAWWHWSSSKYICRDWHLQQTYLILKQIVAIFCLNWEKFTICQWFEDFIMLEVLAVVTFYYNWHDWVLYLCVKQSAAGRGISGRSTVSEQEVQTLPLSMLIRIRSSVSFMEEVEVKINISVLFIFIIFVCKYIHHLQTKDQVITI